MQLVQLWFIKMLKKNNNYKEIIILGVILITFGITLMSNNYIKTRREEAFNNMNLLLLESFKVENITEEEKVTEEVTEEENIQEEVVDNTVNNKIDYEPYIGILKIPKINLERGFYDKNSSLNNVDYNILFHSNSNYPNEENGNVILASHSGTSSISYFKNLYLLEEEDLAYITYQNTLYTYKVKNIYYEEKDGNVAIYRDINKNILTLITCTKNDDSMQTVYILERV